MADENIKWDPIPSVVPQKDEGIKWDSAPKIEVSGTADDLKDYKRTSMFKEYDHLLTLAHPSPSQTQPPV